MHKSEPVLENEKHKILANNFSRIETDHPIKSSRADLVSDVKKKITCHLVNWAVLSRPKVKKCGKSGPSQKTGKFVVYKVEALGTVPRTLKKVCVN